MTVLMQGDVSAPSTASAQTAAHTSFWVDMRMLLSNKVYMLISLVNEHLLVCRCQTA